MPRRIIGRAAGVGAALLASGAAAADEPARFRAEGEFAVMTGEIDESTPGAVRRLLARYPAVTLIVMAHVPGSDDDEANLEAARLIRAAGIDTYLPADGLVASGGTDFFLAGRTRFAEAGACLGVHSWSDSDGYEGASLPRDHPEHRIFLDYYAAMGVPAAFYWYTLNAAPARGMAWMDREAVDRFGIALMPQGAAPGDARACDER